VFGLSWGPGYKKRFDWRVSSLRVTVAIPCYNEATTVAKVIGDFRAQLPDADILVIDNDSSDDTAERARAAGARVVREKRRGKGFVVQKMLETVDADVLVMVDGDDTYFAEDLPVLLRPILDDRADMVVGDRLQDASRTALNDLHRFGNRAILWIINFVFRTSFRDVLSGYRALNRNFMRSVPLITEGFEIETEMTLQALENKMQILEVPIRYRSRPEGSFSKLSPFADGYRILLTMAVLLRNHRPLYFFSLIALGLLLLDGLYAAAWLFGAAPSPSVVVNGLVVAGAVLISGALVVLGIVLNTVTAGFRELAVLSRRPK
jgi:glycosyltransferase involved in cell wall biosynthesis